ncbi:hypothetical protein TNCV_3634811 [Trichonephila clavipes]|nr:hypothetical protein TNCV_3634811 [Trichonephila clavipes]
MTPLSLLLGPPEIAYVRDANGYSGGYQGTQRLPSLQLTSPVHRIHLNASYNSSSDGVGCAMTYIAATLNNSCDNHLSLHL